MKRIVKPHKVRKPSASTGVPSFVHGKDHILKRPVRLQRLVINGQGGYDDGKDETWYDELNNSMLGTGIKFIDPTGISSYYDVYQSARDMYNNPSLSNAGSLALEAFGALPLIGKLGKALKVGKRIIKRAGNPELEKMSQWIIDQGYPRIIGGFKDGYDAEQYNKSKYNKGKDSGIHIKKKNRGKFTALKKRTGKSASWFKAHGTPAQKKMAVFALNARKWHH